MAFVGFKEMDLAWRGQPTSWNSGALTRRFCGHCGSQIAYRDANLPGEVYLTLGFMDEPERYPPVCHAFDKKRLPFLHIADHLPRHDGFSIDR